MITEENTRTKRTHIFPLFKKYSFLKGLITHMKYFINFKNITIGGGESKCTDKREGLN